MGYTGDSVHEECIDDLEAQKEYLGPLKVAMYYNDEIFVPEEYGEDSIKRTSKILYSQINEEKPSYYFFDLQSSILEDQTDFIQFGNGEETYFNSPKQKQLSDFKVYDSGWKNFPTFYKFFSTTITISPDVGKIRRKTESFLDWLGDWGGLLDSLNFLADIFISSYSSYILKTKLAKILVRFLPSEE